MSEQTSTVPSVTFAYTRASASFACSHCGIPLTLTRRSFGSETSGLFCSGCRRHYWITWKTGELHLDQYQGEQTEPYWTRERLHELLQKMREEAE